MGLSELGANARPSATLSWNARGKALKAQGRDIVLFTVGEPDFDTPENIKQAAQQAIEEGFTKYTPAAGMPALREAVAAKFRRDNGLDHSPDQILVSNGGKQAIFQIMLCLVQDGDQVLLPSPYWVSYAHQARMCGAEPVAIDVTVREDFKLTPELLGAAVTARSKLLMLNYPCNPTGVMLNADELRAVVDVALAHELWIISDEMYENLIYDGLEKVSPAGLGARAFERVITVNGVSKSYAMTGWRVGYAGGPVEVIRAAGCLQSNTTGGPCSISQRAALEALNGPQDSVGAMREAFDRRRRIMVEGLNRIPGVRCRMPQGAFYAFPDCRELLGRSYGGRRVHTSTELAEALLQDAGMAVVPGAPFGAEGYLRFSYATSEEDIEKGLERFRAFAATCEA